jgi:hypothetical protein
LRSVVRDLIETRDGATYFAGRVWGVGLRYGGDAADHPLVGRNAPDVTLAGGQRLNEVLRDGRVLLLDLDPAEPLHAIAAERDAQLSFIAGVATVAVDFEAMLVRPDGVVAWAGRRAETFGLAPAVSRSATYPARDRRSVRLRRSPNSPSRQGR